MEPTAEQIKDLITKLDAQYPNPYVKGVAYDAVNPYTNQAVKIRRSFSVGDRVPFLHIYTPCTLVIKSPTGEILSRRASSRHYRANLRTFQIEQID